MIKPVDESGQQPRDDQQPQHDQQLVRIAIVPDTQMMTKQWPGFLTGIADWITDHAGVLDGVLHVGDVVNDGNSDTEQLRRGRTWTEQITDTGLPLFMAPGNHDDDLMLEGTQRDLTAFAEFLLPPKLSEQSWWGGAYGETVTDRAGNYYGWIGRGVDRILVLVLEFGPRSAVVEWARGVLAANATTDAVVLTHVFLDGDGSRTSPGSPYHPRDYPASRDGLDGEDLWAALRDVPNLRIIVSGHQIPPCTSYRVDPAADGHQVLATYQNWQHEPNGGGGRIRILEWDRQTNKVTLCVLNTATAAQEHEPGDDVAVSLAGPADPGPDAISAAASTAPDFASPSRS